MTSQVLDELLRIERAGWDSLCESTGADFYGELMLPEAVMVLANGMVMDRNTVVAALAESPPWRAYELSGVHVIVLDDDNAVLVYTGTAYRDEEEPAFVGAMSSVYHRVDGDWKLALYQQTRKPDQ
ncbi:nuclear transport factor 2 family protein [Mycolicibacterium fortuitum]|uniref:nuclear transport factor 2 family protein n=1 Tax=Mycolicibacterium fortuitum TaxID=1766 RepID=UPI001CE1CAB2|nr:nuclear transport factor 2 family protein [Mycolicibacterium fortuitum]MCA4721334.1 nuclear transport factor 2 family protein [Mycolicibacterium fortuitum]